MSSIELSNLSNSYTNLVDFLIKWISRFVYVNKTKKVLAISYTDSSESIYNFYAHMCNYLDREHKYYMRDMDHEIQDILSQLYHLIPKPKTPLVHKSNKSLRTHKLGLYVVDLHSALEILSSDEEEISPSEWNGFLDSFFNLKLFQGDTIISNKYGINRDSRSLYSKEHILEHKNNIYVIHRWASPCQFHDKRTIEYELTIKDLLVSFFEIKSGKHDLWYELFCDATCQVNTRSKDLVKQEIECIKDTLSNTPSFEPYLANMIHDYAYSKRILNISTNFDHGS